MAYRLVWSPKSRDQLLALDKEIARRIVAKALELEKTDNPRHFLERMVDSTSLKLRVGDWRAIVDIDEQAKEINVLKVGHRKKVYKQA